MNILVVGALIFGAHLFTGIFSRTRVPDVLLLTIIGIILGPVLHLVKPRNSIRPTLLLTGINFLLTLTAIGFASHFLSGLDMRIGLMLGAIVASTSPAMIVPLTRRLRIDQPRKLLSFWNRL